MVGRDEKKKPPTNKAAVNGFDHWSNHELRFGMIFPDTTMPYCDDLNNQPEKESLDVITATKNSITALPI